MHKLSSFLKELEILRKEFSRDFQPLSFFVEFLVKVMFESIC